MVLIKIIHYSNGVIFPEVVWLFFIDLLVRMCPLTPLLNQTFILFKASWPWGINTFFSKCNRQNLFLGISFITNYWAKLPVRLHNHFKSILQSYYWVFIPVFSPSRQSLLLKCFLFVLGSLGSLFCYFQNRYVQTVNSFLWTQLTVAECLILQSYLLWKHKPFIILPLWKSFLFFDSL